jgi:tyrosine-specific transport protein
MIKSKLLGSTMMVAGTSIGAAMIAMPITAAKIGFSLSILLLLIISAVMYYAAILVSRIYEITNSNSTVAKMAGDAIGKTAQIICSAATLILMYSLMVAYVSGLSESLSELTKISKTNIVIIISIVLFFSLGISNKIFDYYNRAAFSLKIVFMFLMTFILLPHISTTNIISSSIVISDSGSILTVLPVFVTSFGFHAGIPVIFKHLDMDHHQYKKAILYGVLLTLTIYVIWLTITFGVLSDNGLYSSDGDLSNFIALLSSSTKSDFLSKSIHVFITLAILTSLFGVSTTIFDFSEEILKDIFKFNNSFLSSFLVFFTPMILTIINKNLFVKALGLAGVALTIIAIFIPSIICIKKDSKVYHPITLCICIGLGIATVIGEVMIFLALT